MSLGPGRAAGGYSALAALRPNAQLLLSQGYTGAGRVATHLLYVDEWTHVRGPDTREVAIAASDRAGWLARQARRPVSYAGRSVGYIAADLAALGGFEAATLVDAQAQFGEPILAFALRQGEGYLRALDRLLAVYDGSWRVECRPGAGVAFGAVESLHILGKGAGDAVQHAYGDEVESLQVSHSGDRANRVLIFGALGNAAAYSEGWDWADVAETGQERAVVAVEPQAGTAGEAAVRAALELARERPGRNTPAWVETE